MFNSADTAWMIVATALVLLMTPALGFFYGGMLKKESMLSMLGQSIIAIGIVTVLWVTIGFSLAFGPDQGGFIGNFNYAFMNGLTTATSGIAPATTIPPLLLVMFECVFAIITVDLITGGIAERIKLSVLAVFFAVWTMVIYVPVAHWVWGGGWLQQIGAIDFAGGTVVHITAGVSALAGALVIGKRLSKQNNQEDPAHNIPFVVLGGVLLWFGWFGFNAGSALTIMNSTGTYSAAVSAFTATQIAAATAGIVWGLISYFHTGRTSVLGMITGAVVGLVAITPASGYVDPMGALAIGIICPFVSYGAIQLRKRAGFDDALDVWACHGMGGTTGALLTGVFCTTAAGAPLNGLAYGGGFSQLIKQVIAVAAVWAYVFVVVFALFWIITKVYPKWRITKDEERIGVDIVQHGENAYN